MYRKCLFSFHLYYHFELYSLVLNFNKSAQKNNGFDKNDISCIILISDALLCTRSRCTRQSHRYA